MCGIAGYISLNNTISQQQLKNAAAVMQHRGPDAEGFYFTEDNTVGLAHRRLSILDLSAAANQPMLSADHRYCIVFNGEVYNFRDLKLELKDKGASLQTTSDTEVILQLFIEKGTAAFAMLNGMFALAIYDRHTTTLTLARDHAGIKPLFIYQHGNDLIFASELKVIRSVKNRQLTINKAAIPQFLHLGYIPHPYTIYEHTWKFPSGSYCQVKTNGNAIPDIKTVTTTFWDPAACIQNDLISDGAAAKQTLKKLLEDAVSKQMISDVPIGTFLSGGVDSSLVTAIAARQTPHQVKTFSIAIDNGKYNESAYAAAVANTLKTDHHEFRVTEKEVMQLTDRLMPAYDEPYADPSAFPTMMVSKLARQHVTVALSGDGGDELFMGYNAYAWAKRFENPVTRLVRKPIHFASSFAGNRAQRAGQLFNYPSLRHIHSHIFSAEQYYFPEQELSHLLTNPAFNFGHINELPATARDLSLTEKQSLWDFRSYLKDELLVKSDRASMQFSLEARVPLLDYRIAAFAFNLHPNLKMHPNGTMKYLLKQVLYDYLPASIFERPKWGFTIPLTKWLKTDLFPLMDQYTSKAVIEKHGYVQYEKVAAIKKEYLAGKDFLYGRLWLLMLLHWWLEENKM